MQEHVRLQRAHEDKGSGAGIPNPNHSGIAGATEVVTDDSKTAAWRGVAAGGVEGEDEGSPGAAMHVDREVCAEGGLNERHKAFCQIAKDQPGVGSGIDRPKSRNELGQLDRRSLHGHGEQLLLGTAVAEHGGRADLQPPGDFAERGRLETLLDEDGPGGLQDLATADAGRASHS